MYSSKNILVVCIDLEHSQDAIEQAIEMAHINLGKVNVSIIVPEFPSAFDEHRNQYIDFLREKLLKLVEQACVRFDANIHSLLAKVRIHPASNGATSVIERVIEENIEVVIKQKTKQSKEEGVDAFDMNLLRKCPCPVWLCSPIRKEPSNIQVAVALDVNDDDVHDLKATMLKSAGELALDFNQKLIIISCWENVIEAAMLQTGWLNLSEEEVNQQLKIALDEHQNKIDTLVKNANLSPNLKVVVDRKNGIPSAQIPESVSQNDVDILVMGTLARTGIAGFFMGNTSENIVQQVKSSLIAFKPANFVSPVGS